MAEGTRHTAENHRSLGIKKMIEKGLLERIDEVIATHQKSHDFTVALGWELIKKYLMGEKCSFDDYELKQYGEHLRLNGQKKLLRLLKDVARMKGVRGV